MRPALLLAALVLMPACTFGKAKLPRTQTPGQIEDRESVADRKKKEGDPTYVEEYQVAIGLAEAAAADAVIPLRDAMLLLSEGRPPISWRQRVNQTVVAMTPAERGHVQALIADMSASAREGTVRWLSSDGPRDALSYRVPGALSEWRVHTSAVARMRSKCDACR